MPKKTVKENKTFTRYMIVRGVKKDFGLGPGVIVKDQIVFKDDHGRGFDNPMFEVRLLQEKEKFIWQHIEVKLEEAKPKRRKK